MVSRNSCSNSPLVSVIVPAYNAAKYLAQNIESVLQQSYRNFELLVVDDGSMDDTARLVARYGDCVKYFRKQNGGGASARNYGIARSRGEFIAPLDADDFWKPDKLAQSMRVFETTPEAGMVFTACTVVDDQGEKLFDYYPRFDQRRLYQQLLLKNFIPNGTAIIRKNILDAIGGYDEWIFIPNDWDLWLRVAEVTNVAYLPEPLSCYRRAATSISQDLDRQLQEQIFVLKKAAARNARLDRDTLRRALASQHYMMGHACLKTDQPSRACQALLQSLNLHLLGWKAWVLLGMLVTGASKIGVLRNRLLR